MNAPVPLRLRRRDGACGRKPVRPCPRPSIYLWATVRGPCHWELMTIQSEAGQGIFTECQRRYWGRRKTIPGGALVIHTCDFRKHILSNRKPICSYFSHIMQITLATRAHTGLLLTSGNTGSEPSILYTMLGGLVLRVLKEMTRLCVSLFT